MLYPSTWIAAGNKNVQGFFSGFGYVGPERYWYFRCSLIPNTSVVLGFWRSFFGFLNFWGFYYSAQGMAEGVVSKDAVVLKRFQVTEGVRSTSKRIAAEVLMSVL